MDLRKTVNQMHLGRPLIPSAQHPPPTIFPGSCPQSPGAPDSLQGQEGQLDLHFPSSQVRPMNQI